MYLLWLLLGVFSTFSEASNATSSDRGVQACSPSDQCILLGGQCFKKNKNPKHFIPVKVGKQTVKCNQNRCICYKLEDVWEEIQNIKERENTLLTEIEELREKNNVLTMEIYNNTKTTENLQERINNLTMEIYNNTNIIEECCNTTENLQERINNLTMQIYNNTNKIEECCNTTEVLLDSVIIQRRGQFGNAPEFFSDKLWTDYEEGFGDQDKELWLGLKTISSLTSSGTWELEVHLTDYDGNHYYAVYDHFKVDESDTYNLHVSGFDTTRSNAKDSLSNHDGAAFSTKDRDNDASSSNCAALYRGAWWYTACHSSNLNGYNYNDGNLPHTWEYNAKGIIWRNENNVGDQDHFFSWPWVEMRIVKTSGN